MIVPLRLRGSHGGFETPIEPPLGGGETPAKKRLCLGLDPAEPSGSRLAGPKAQSEARAKAALKGRFRLGCTAELKKKNWLRAELFC